MTPAEAASILRQHNAWRRDDTKIVSPANPTQIGLAIDVAVEVLASADPWRGLYDPEKISDRAARADGMAWHPDLPSWPDDREDDIAPLLAAQGFDYEGVSPGEEFSEEALEEGGDLYWEQMKSWNPSPPAGEHWRLAAVTDTEDGPYALFVRPLALAGSEVDHA
ncbi:hypothetical protein [Pseudoxanthomonas sp. USHLN014]|uniref:hypothetical protein n=1 Tax=Pseudoxanthomonas sp. USHLN014 TaxID=3081297 RepID=UPI00301B71A7